MFVLNNQLIPA